MQADALSQKRLALFHRFTRRLHESHERHKRLQSWLRSSAIGYEAFHAEVDALAKELLELKRMSLDLEEERLALIEEQVPGPERRDGHGRRSDAGEGDGEA